MRKICTVRISALVGGKLHSRPVRGETARNRPRGWKPLMELGFNSPQQDRNMQAAPPVPDIPGGFGMQAPQMPPCLTNVARLCDLKDITVRSFSTSSEESVLQAYKCALIQVGLAVCWRMKVDKESNKLYDMGTPGGEVPLTPASPGPAAVTAVGSGTAAGAAVSASAPSQGSNSEMPPPPSVYELWTFGTPELQQRLFDEAPPGVMDQLQVSLEVVPVDQAISSLPDCLLLLSDSFTNRAERLVAKASFLRLGDSFLPAMDPEDPGNHSPLPGIHMQCFLRDMTLMAIMTVKLKRVSHLGDLTAEPGASDAIEVLLSPQGMPGVVKSSWTAQVNEGDAARVTGEWEELGEPADTAARYDKYQLPRAVLVEMDGETVLYPASRVLRLSPTHVAAAPHLEHIWMANGPRATHTSRSTVNNAVHSFRSFLAGPTISYDASQRSLPPTQPFSRYWVFASIPQHCIMPLTRPKKPSIEPPATPTGADAGKAGPPGAIAAANNNTMNNSNGNNNGGKRKAVPPVTIPSGMTTPGAPASGGPTPTANKRGKKGTGKDTPTGAGPGSVPETVPENQAGEGGADTEVLAAGGGPNKKGGKAQAGRGRKGSHKDTPASSANTPLPTTQGAGGVGAAGEGQEVMSSLTAPLQSPRLGDSAPPGSARRQNAAAFSLLNDDFNQSVDVGKDELMDIGDLGQLEDEFDNDGTLFDFYDSADKTGGGDDDLMGDFGSAVDHADVGMHEAGGEKLDDLDLGGQMEWSEMDAGPAATSAAPEGNKEEAEAKAEERAGAREAPAEAAKAPALSKEEAEAAERNKDAEMLAKVLTQLPPVPRRPHLITVRGAHSLGPGLPLGLPMVPGMFYGPSTARSAPEPVDGEAAADQRDDEAGPSDDVPIPGPAPEGGEGGLLGLAGRRVPPHVKMIAAWRSSQLRTRRTLQSAQRAWLQSRSVAIYYKCCRWTLMDKCLSKMLKGKNRPAEAVARMVPLEHRLIHHMSATSFDMPVRTSALTPSSALGPEGQYRVHSALIYRPILTRAGLAPHLSLEHVMKGECGEDPRVMMALDPLSMPAPPSTVADTLAQVLGALDSLVPGSDQHFTLLDLPTLLGEPSVPIEQVAETLAPPQLLVGSVDGDWMEAPAGAIRWWEKIPLEPVAKKKDVLYCVLCASAEQQGHEVVAAQLLLRELSCVYESMQLGRHRAIDSRFLSIGPGPGAVAPKDGILQVQGFAPNAAPPGGPKMLSFDEASTRALRAFTIALDDKNSIGQMGSSGPDSRNLPVLYILEPDFSIGASWGGPRHEVLSPAKARHQWQRAIAKTLSLEAVKSPRLLDLVVQTLPAQRVNCGRNMRWLLRDLAMSVYSKGRGRQRVRPERENALSVVELEHETPHFFSGSVLGIKKQRVEPKLYEPFLVVAEPLDPAVAPAPVPDMAKEMLMAPPPEPNDDEPGKDAAEEAKDRADDAANAPPTLHCSYSWSDDGLCLGGAITDTTGETLETFSALYAGVGPTADPSDDKAKEGACRAMLRKLWGAVEEWTKSNYVARVRVVLGALGAHSTRDIEDWKEVLESAGCGSPESCCIEVAVVHVAVLHSLQLLSTQSAEVSREDLSKTHFEGWPHTCDPVTSMELAASTVLEPRPSYLLRSTHRFSFPPAVPHLPLPLASALMVTPATRDEEETLCPGTQSRSSWPVILDVSLLLCITGIRSIKPLDQRHHQLVAEVSRTYHNLSWASTHPCFPLRQSVLPFHFLVSRRIAMAAAAVV